MKFLILLLTCILNLGFAEIPKDTIAAKKLFLKIDTLFEKGEYENALTQSASLSEYYKSIKKNAQYHLVQQKRAEILSRMGDYEKANETVNNSLVEISEQKGMIVPKILLINSLGYLYLTKGRNDLALEKFKEALSICPANLFSEYSETLNNLGLAYWNGGNTDLALEHYEKALSIRKEKYGENHKKTAAIYNNIGLLYSASDANKALENYSKALKIYQKIYGESKNLSLAIAYNNLGIIYRQQKDFNAAIINFDKVLAIYTAIYSEKHPNVAFTYSNIGQVFLERNSFTKAEENFKMALNIYVQNFGEKHPEIANTRNLLGTLYLNQDKYKSAVNEFQQALGANHISFSDKNIYQNPTVQGYYNANLLLTSLSLKSQALEQYHFNKSLKKKDLIHSLSTLMTCDTLIDHIRQSRTNKADKVALGAIASDIYESAIKICLDLAEVSINSKYYENLAFYFNEKSKASVLLEAISESNAKQFAGIPDSLLEKERQLKAEIAFYEQKLAEKPDSKLEKSYRDKLFSQNRVFEKFTNDLGKNYPDYYNLKFNVSIVKSNELSPKMNKNTALLSYFIGDKSGRVYIFIVSAKGLKVVNVAKLPDLEKQITALRNSIKFDVPESFLAVSNLLYKQLIPNELFAGINELIIVPDGKLGTIPFESLVAKKSLKDSFKDSEYLIKKFAISYAYSATLWWESQTKPQNEMSKSVMVCAPIEFAAVETKEYLPSLPGTENEVNKISQLFTDKKLACRTLIGKNATETEIKNKALSSYSFLHFATHGVVNETHPELSEIFLNGDKTNKEDGNLYSGEIFNLNIKASLVTLSACQTGLGRVTKGEGIIGLSRALLYAGAQNIIVSLWTVSDESTSKLMVDFYTDVLNKNSSQFSGSLREAKLELMKNEKYANPYYWAPFVLVGK
jgi:CHAT domain-containing protein/Tfp pilus assembly protein PilF